MKSIHGGDIYNNKVNMDFSVNINPLGIPHSVKEAMSDALSYADRYPDMACSGLKKAISEYFTQQGCSIQSEDVIPGNGASELFMAIAHAIKPKKAVLLAPGFFGYEHVLRAVGCDIGYFLLDEQSDFSPAARLDTLMDMLTDDTDIFFIAFDSLVNDLNFHLTFFNSIHRLGFFFALINSDVIVNAVFIL